MLKRRGNRDNHGWISIRELMSEMRMTQAEAIAELRALFSKVSLEFIPGNGIIHNRYRLTPGVEVVPADEESPAVDERPGQVAASIEHAIEDAIERPVALASPPAQPLQVQDPVAVGAEAPLESSSAAPAATAGSVGSVYTGPERRKAPGGRHAGADRPGFVERRGARDRSGRFHDGSDAAGAMGALAQIPVMTIEPGMDQGDAVVVVDLKRRPGSSRIAIALEDAVRIGQQAVEAMLLKSSVAAQKPPAPTQG